MARRTARLRHSVLLFAALLAPSLSTAAIYKFAVPTDQEIKLYWWPVLRPIRGWVHDEVASRANGINALIPNGSTFAAAPAVIYATAIFKPRAPETTSLAELIDEDRKTFEQDFPGVSVTELAPISAGDGQKLRYFSYTPSHTGSWERVAYGEEGEFYLIFTVSGSSKSFLRHALRDFEAFISEYRERP